MNFADYQTVFKDSGMRAWISWEILSRFDCSISEIYTRSLDVLSNFFTVWYITPSGLNGDWRNAGDSPLTIGDAVKASGIWPHERKQSVEAFREKFMRRSEPVQLVLPAYAPNSRDIILLDGTHRAAAAFTAQSDIRLLVFAVNGPCDPDVLPDLLHYSP
jgi:hypothetical protein